MSDVQDIILHWYPRSPYAQKVSWVLNYKNVEYKTVLISMVEPRDTRRPLDGGYRRTPILQIGNHVYCDTKSIFLALEKLYPEPSLYPKFKNSDETCIGVTRSFNSWIDNTVFNNIVSLFPWHTLDKAFLEDREGLLGKNADFEAFTANAPFMKATIQADFTIAEETLGSKTWVLDTETPSLADFDLAMIVFFAQVIAGEAFFSNNFKTLFDHKQRVLDTVASLGRAETLPVISAEEAIEVLRRYQDIEIEPELKFHSSILPVELGQQVSVTPLDSYKIPVVGTLVRSTVHETVISHKNTEYGTTSLLHFPTPGYVVLPQHDAK